MNCLCFARDATKHKDGTPRKPERYQWHSGTLWAIYPLCQEHESRFTTPVWTQRIGRLDAETASTVEAEAV